MQRYASTELTPIEGRSLPRDDDREHHTAQEPEGTEAPAAAAESNSEPRDAVDPIMLMIGVVCLLILLASIGSSIADGRPLVG